MVLMYQLAMLLLTQVQLTQLYASTDLNASSMAVGVTVGAVSIDMAQNAEKANRNDDNSSATGFEDVKSTNMGVTYTL